MSKQVAPEEQRGGGGGWNKDHEQGDAEEPSGNHLKMLSCAQVLALLGTSLPSSQHGFHSRTSG